MLQKELMKENKYTYNKPPQGPMIPPQGAPRPRA